MINKFYILKLLAFCIYVWISFKVTFKSVILYYLLENYMTFFAVSEAVILNSLSYQEAWEMVIMLNNVYLYVAVVLSGRNVLNMLLYHTCSPILGQTSCIHVLLFQ